MKSPHSLGWAHRAIVKIRRREINTIINTHTHTHNEPTYERTESPPLRMGGHCYWVIISPGDKSTREPQQYWGINFVSNRNEIHLGKGHVVSTGWNPLYRLAARSSTWEEKVEENRFLVKQFLVISPNENRCLPHCLLERVGRKLFSFFSLYSHFWLSSEEESEAK